MPSPLIPLPSGGRGERRRGGSGPKGTSTPHPHRRGAYGGLACPLPSPNAPSPLIPLPSDGRGEVGRNATERLLVIHQLVTELPGGGSHMRMRSEERRVGKECRSRWSP